jgi:hypothetical protein
MEKIDNAVVLFGEAEKGSLATAYYCDSLQHLFEYLGQPPQETLGLFFAVQSLLYGMPCIYFRVQEEGISYNDYQFGFKVLHNTPQSFLHIGALYLPGVGTRELIEEGIVICREHHSFLLMNEHDFYDYLTEKAA